MNSSPPGSSVHGILQARILQWVALSFSRGSSRPRDRTCSSCIGTWILYRWATWEAPCLVLGVTRDFLPPALLPFFLSSCPSSSFLLSFSFFFLFLSLFDLSDRLPEDLKIKRLLFKNTVQKTLITEYWLPKKQAWISSKVTVNSLTQHHCKMITILLNKFETRKKRKLVSNCVYNTISKGNHVTFQLKLLFGICLQCASTSFILELPLENCPE